MESPARAVIAPSQNEAYIRQAECKSAHKKGPCATHSPPNQAIRPKPLLRCSGLSGGRNLCGNRRGAVGTQSDRHWVRAQAVHRAVGTIDNAANHATEQDIARASNTAAAAHRAVNGHGLRLVAGFRNGQVKAGFALHLQFARRYASKASAGLHSRFGWFRNDLKFLARAARNSCAVTTTW